MYHSVVWTWKIKKKWNTVDPIPLFLPNREVWDRTTPSNVKMTYIPYYYFNIAHHHYLASCLQSSFLFVSSSLPHNLVYMYHNFISLAYSYSVNGTRTNLFSHLEIYLFFTIILLHVTCPTIAFFSARFHGRANLLLIHITYSIDFFFAHYTFTLICYTYLN